MNLDYERVCSKHKSIFEAYYNQIDPKGSGAIEAMTAAKFLKKSGLSDVVLSRIWDLSDPDGKGFLDQKGFFIALKLVSLAQAGQVINMSNIYTETPNPPKVGDIPRIMPPRISNMTTPAIVPGSWSISVIDRLKYEQLFETLQPVSGMLPGARVKTVLVDSKLPLEVLGRIWDLADQDKDGNLDKHEFIVAMHLVYQTLNKRTVPDVLPPELRKTTSVAPPKPIPPVTQAAMPRAPSGEGFGDAGFVANFPKDIAPPPAIPPLPLATRVPPIGAVAASQPLICTDPLISIGASPSVTANADWVVNVAELKRFEVLFRDSDRDKDGLVSGLEVKNVFLQSGVPQQCLAHIWALCDTNQSGKLTLEQFALAMWMVERKQKGIEPPQVLTANMVPPSLRSHVTGVEVQPQAEPKPTYSNPELEMISKEIEELAKERRSIETEIAQKEADIRIKSGEMRSLQSELDTLSATLKQLENQRGEAQKRLDDLKAQVSKVRDQCQKQEETINEQEGEINAKRSELQKLKDEEAVLQKEYDENNCELNKLTEHLQKTQLQISSVRSMVTELLETQRQMTDALLMCRAAIENQDPNLCTEYQLKIEPDFHEARQTLEKKVEDSSKADPFGGNAFSKTAVVSNSFHATAATNGFGNSDPFTANSSNIRTAVGFDDSFSASSAFDSGGFDAFGNSSNVAFSQQQQRDPFGGGTDSFGANRAVTPDPSKDDFGSDPFASLHAPTGQGQVLSPNSQRGPPPRPESPSPALPPKKSKVPPPRPAPPRPLQAPGRNTQPTMDAFGAATSSGGGAFADFADFDNKLPIIPQSTLPSLTTSNLPTTTLNASLFDNNFTQISSASSTPSPSMFASISTVATTTTTATKTASNSNLTRSITPLQQAAASIFSTLNYTAPAAATKTPTINGPTDFSDDPFKDYRYEDPFNIKDPFADDDNDDEVANFDAAVDNTKSTDTIVQVIKSDLSSDSDDIESISKTNEESLKTSKPKNALTANFENLKLSNEFDNQFDAFAMDTPSLFDQPRTTTTISSKNNNNNNKSPVSAAAGGLFDSFADFDAFSTHSSTSTSSTLAVKKPNNTANQYSDSFFDDFNDNFDTTTNISTAANANAAISSADIFSAFGEIKNLNALDSADNNNKFDAFNASDINTNTKRSHNAITKSEKLFDDSFDDDFFKTQADAFSFNNTNNNNKSLDNSKNDEHFAKFDAFADRATEFIANFSPSFNNTTNKSKNDNMVDVVDGTMGAATMQNLIKVQNLTLLSKTPNQEVKSKGIENGVKLSEKFAPDYSRPETFEDDLQAAIQRSMRDQ